jgi:hypothetical protein
MYIKRNNDIYAEHYVSWHRCISKIYTLDEELSKKAEILWKEAELVDYEDQKKQEIVEEIKKHIKDSQK